MKRPCMLMAIALAMASCIPDSAPADRTASPGQEPAIPAAAAPSAEAPSAEPSPLTGRFIGQVPPGSEPVQFGRGFFRGSFHSAPVFSPDGGRAWWAGQYSTAKIYTTSIEEGAWTEPSIIRFSDSIGSYRDPFIAPDGSAFYFISQSPFPGSNTGGKENIWMMERTANGWGEPSPLPESINALELHWTVSVASNLDLYFSAKEGAAKADILVSRRVGNAYSAPVRLPPPVNTDAAEITPNIAPDGSYLLFSRIDPVTDTPWLFVSFAGPQGWSEPARVENVPYCISPIVTPDRGYVVYLSSVSTFAWRDTSFVEELRPK